MKSNALQQLQQLKPTSALSFDDDFGDFVAVAAAATAAAKMPSCALQQQQLSQQLTLLDNDSENVVSRDGDKTRPIFRRHVNCDHRSLVVTFQFYFYFKKIKFDYL